jgi:hypothetical protein
MWVVVHDVFGEHGQKMPLADDQESVQALAANGTDPVVAKSSIRTESLAQFPASTLGGPAGGALVGSRRRHLHRGLRAGFLTGGGPPLR